VTTERSLVRTVADLVEAAKAIARQLQSDKVFIAAYHKARPLDSKLIEDRIKVTDLDPRISQRAIDHIRRLPKAAG
jgi:hypothetical protein